jgi:hypothetical protein
LGARVRACDLKLYAAHLPLGQLERRPGALARLARHPDYRGQLVVSIAEDGRVVTMRDGDVQVSPLFG